MKQFIFLLILTLFINSTYGQKSLFEKTKYRKGYFVTKTDSINCYIEYLGMYNDYSRHTYLKYKLNENDKKSLKVKLNKINKLKLIDIYERVELNGSTVLMRLCVNGDIKLYERGQSINIGVVRSPVINNNYYGGSNKKPVFYLRKDGQMFKIKKKKHLAEVLNEK